MLNTFFSLTVVVVFFIYLQFAQWLILSGSIRDVQHCNWHHFIIIIIIIIGGGGGGSSSSSSSSSSSNGGGGTYHFL